jgi:hypothetical protein
MVPRWLGKTWHPPREFELQPFWNSYSYGVRSDGLEVTFNGMKSVVNLIKTYELFQKLVAGGGTYADRIVISFAYIFRLGKKVG